MADKEIDVMASTRVNSRPPKERLACSASPSPQARKNMTAMTNETGAAHLVAPVGPPRKPQTTGKQDHAYKLTNNGLQWAGFHRSDQQPNRNPRIHER